MKKSLSFLFCLLCFTGIKAQQSIIALTDTRVFYAEMLNPIKIILEGVDSSDIIVRCYNGVITGNYGNYNLSVQMGPSRICTVVAGMQKKNGDTVWVKEEEFKIRPRPPVYFTVNGKEGGSITVSEMQVWNFVNASYGPTFSRDGYMLEVIDYDVVCESRNEIIKMHQTGTPAITDSMKIVLSTLDADASISFYNFKYKEHNSSKIYDVSSGLTFTLMGTRIESTIYRPVVKSQSQAKEQEEVYDYGSLYQYAGSWSGNKKDGLWITRDRKCQNKVGETLYHLDTILEERQYYTNGELLSQTKFNKRDTSASISVYSEGRLCYHGNYKVDYSHRAFMESYNGAYQPDNFYNDTSIKEEHSAYYLYRYNLVPQKPLIGEWKFFYPNGALAARGHFVSRLVASAGDYEGPPRYYYEATRNGEWVYYYPNSAIFKKVVYDHGQEVQK